MRTYFIQEVTVMGYDDDRVLEIDQEVFEPLDCLKVKVIRRLIKKQDIGFAE